MTRTRAHRPAVSAEAALAELRRCAGTQFDPAVVRAFSQAHEAYAASHAGPLAA